MAASAWGKSICRRMRASRRLLPISNTSRKGTGGSPGRLLRGHEHAVHAERNRGGDADVEAEPRRNATEPHRPAAGERAGGGEPRASHEEHGEQPERDGDRRGDIEAVEQ